MRRVTHVTVLSFPLRRESTSGATEVTHPEDPRGLRLKFEAGLSDSQIGHAIGSARFTVQECLRRAKEAGVGWPLPEVGFYLTFGSYRK